MTAAAAPRPVDVRRLPRRDFSLLWLAQLVSTAGSSLTDLAAGIFVFAATGSALAVGLTLMVTAIPSLVVGLLAGVYVDRHDRQADHDRDLPDPGGHRRPHRRSSSGSRRSRSRAVRSCSCQRRGQAVLRPGPRQPDPGDRDRRGAGGGELVPVDRVVRVHRDRVRRRPACWPARSASSGPSSSMPRRSWSRPAASR